ncbi:MAG: hypothetical protein IPN34_09480 [Planctomycetes bacterium]|nr:hypothetical protein [Planctomycetota bacterium]
MRYMGLALDIVGHDEDGPSVDRCFLFGASIEGARTYAITTSELGAQDAEDHYALEGLWVPRSLALRAGGTGGGVKAFASGGAASAPRRPEAGQPTTLKCNPAAR